MPLFAQAVGGFYCSVLLGMEPILALATAAWFVMIRVAVKMLKPEE
jgi:hypothetical protein